MIKLIVVFIFICSILHAQTTQATSEENYEKNWLVAGDVRVTRITDEQNHTLCYVAKSHNGVAISCLQERN